MICKNCGAKISKDELLCPYCGTENSEVAQREQQDYIKAYKKKKRMLKNVPEKVVKKTTKWLMYCAMGMFGIVILILIVVFAFSKLTNGDVMARQEMELAKLEEYYVAADYEKMSGYLERLDSTGSRGGRYEKYWRIARLYDSMDWHLESLQSNAEYIKTIDLDAINVESDLERCIAVLYGIYKMRELEFPYGEKDGALYVESQYISALKEYALLNDEEIESAVLRFEFDGQDNDYMELAEISIQRMEEQFR